MKGILLHGGFGTRLRPLTHSGPKQLIKVAGRPVSEWCLLDLRDSGIKDVAIVLGELAPTRVIEYYGDGSRLEINITYVYQGYPYGLAHALYVCREYVRDEPFVMYLGDNILTNGISSYVKEFLSSDADAMVLLTKVEDPRRFGVAKFDERGRLVGLVEKPKEPPSNYALVGVYFFRPPYIFKVIERLRPSWRGELEITDAIQKLLESGFKVSYAFVEGWWKDTGTPEDILEVNRLLLDVKYSKQVVLGKVESGAKVEGRVYVSKDARILDGSIVRGPAYIGAGAVMGPGTYVGPYTSVGDNAELIGVEVENSVVMDGVVLEGRGIRIVDSLVGAGASVRISDSIPTGSKLIVGEQARLWLRGGA